jgi:hypothetical protein
MKQSVPARRRSGDGPTSQSLLANPLDFISEDHLRERQICAVIDGLAMATTLDRQAALTVLRFLNEELNVYLRDEAEDLFPLLARRCTEEDSIENTISRIRADQDEVTRLLPLVRVPLAEYLDTGADLTAEGRTTLTEFAGRVRSHLVAAHAIRRPIARARLTQADLRLLSEHMRSRRGLPPIQETTNAE